jgi:isopentenyl-diphosphate delta-isomerase
VTGTTPTGSNRKDDHVRLAEELTTRTPAAAPTGGFHDLRFMHHSFNGLARDTVDISTTVTGTHWPVPFYINAMTGGSEKTGQINADLARAAASAGVAMASGSVSAALRDPALEPTFRTVRDNALEAFVFANVSPEVTVDQARRAVDLLDADALQVHVNPAQELVMPEGDRDFRPWLDRIADIVAGVDVPVVVKEVGFGLSYESIAELSDRGVGTVDVSGRGGTNFIDIENHRRSRQEYSYLSGWGQTTAECLLDTLHGGHPVPEVEVLASGGVRTPLDVVRALALGAGAVGVSGHFLHLLVNDGPDALAEELAAWAEQVRTLMTLLGAADVASLAATDILVTGETAEFAGLRGVDLPALAHRSAGSGA